MKKILLILVNLICIKSTPIDNFNFPKNSEKFSNQGFLSALTKSHSSVESKYPPINSNLYQGDILLTSEQEAFRKQEHKGSDILRTGLTSYFYRWPKDWNGKVIVPYTITTYNCKFGKLKTFKKVSV